MDLLSLVCWVRVAALMLLPRWGRGEVLVMGDVSGAMLTVIQRCKLRDVEAVMRTPEAVGKDVSDVEGETGAR